MKKEGADFACDAFLEGPHVLLGRLERVNTEAGSFEPGEKTQRNFLVRSNPDGKFGGGGAGIRAVLFKNMNTYPSNFNNFDSILTAKTLTIQLL